MNGPASFLAGLFAAFQRVNVICGINAEMLLSNLDNPASEACRVMRVFINEILEVVEGPFLLVLDDLRVITEREIYKALDYFIEYQPPQMHLAVGTRQDPPLALARLRARRQLAELRPRPALHPGGSRSIPQRYLAPGPLP